MHAASNLDGELSSIEADVNVSSGKVGASVWRLGPGGTLISSTTEELAIRSASSDRQAIYFYADLDGSSELKFDSTTMDKVFDALGAQGLSQNQIIGAVNAMQNAGLYFREANF